MTKQKRFYVPPEWEDILDKMEEILKREGSTFSGWVRDQIGIYVRLHEPGNPQQRLDTIIQLGEAYHAPKIAVCHQPQHYGVGCSAESCPLIYREEDFELKKRDCEFIS